jgi:hypothetical protein
MSFGNVPCVGFGAGGGGVGGGLACTVAAIALIPYPAKVFCLGWYASLSLVAKYLFEG